MVRSAGSARPLCSSAADTLPPSRPTRDTPLGATSVENVPSDCDPRKASLHMDAQIALDGRKSFFHSVGSMPVQLLNGVNVHGSRDFDRRVRTQR